jgi:hypothetical protein
MGFLVLFMCGTGIRIFEIEKNWKILKLKKLKIIKKIIKLLEKKKTKD